MILKGIDVSDNQGVIDWGKVKAAGCDFAILRSVRRSGKPDSQFAANVAGCQGQDIPIDVYKYTYATTPTAALEEAKQVIALLLACGIKCRIWWDVEDRDALHGLGSGVLTGLIQTARNYIVGAGYEFGIYTGLYVYGEKWFDFDAFDCPFWVARYYKGYNVMQFGDIPDADAKPDIGRDIAGWQYTSSGRVQGINGNVDLNIRYVSWPAELPGETQARQHLVDCALQWMGYNEADGSHKAIIDIYNNHLPLARRYKLKYTDSWCAAMVSAAAIVAGYTDIIPTECSCGQMVSLYSKAGRWIEDDAYVPDIGDVIFYDWEDCGVGDNAGWPDHVGIVVSVKDSSITAIEGNKDNKVAYRTIDVNGKGIRGYGVPDYASKATVKEPEYYLQAVWHGNSISRALESIGEDGSYQHRAEIAAVNGIAGYTGTAIQNTHMLNLLRTGQLRKV